VRTAGQATCRLTSWGDDADNPSWKDYKKWIENENESFGSQQTAALVLTLLVVLFSPIASAQTDRRRSTQDYIRDLEAALYVIQSNYVDEVDTEELFKGAMDGLFTQPERSVFALSGW
jgi:hypothetical protein